MKVLIAGDQFMTTDVMTECLKDAFKDSSEPIETVYLSNMWPIEPVKRNDEVREYCGGDEEFMEVIKDVDVLLTHTGCITKRVIDAAENLKVIGVGRGGPVNINIGACTEKKIPVMYAPGRNAGAVAEFTVGMMLAASRNIAACHDSFHNDKKWRGDMYAFSYIGSELSQSTVGLVGLGAIGGHVARILKGFGAKVLAYDPYISEENKKKSDCTFTDMETLLKESDIVSLHARYTPETGKIIKAEQIALMKETAILVNTARGELVDHDALYAALKDKKIKGAALDIFEEEPPSDDSPVFELDNVVACTHLGGASKQAAIIGATVASQGIYQIINGLEPVYCANKEVL